MEAIANQFSNQTTNPSLPFQFDSEAKKDYDVNLKHMHPSSGPQFASETQKGHKKQKNTPSPGDASGLPTVTES